MNPDSRPFDFRFVFIGIAIIYSLVSGGCSDTLPTKFRIGVNPWPGYEFLYLAKSLGYFHEAGLDVELVPLGSQGDVRRAFERGQIDIAALTLVEAILTASQGDRDAKAFYVTDYSNGSDMLLAKPTIRQCSDLRGKRIALEPATVDALMVHLALDSCGLTFHDIVPVPMAQGAMPEAWAAAQIDALETYPPTAAIVSAQYRLNKIFDSSKVPETVADVFVADGHTIAENQTELARLLQAFDKARYYFETNRPDAIARISNHLGIDSSELEDSFKGIRIVPLAEQPNNLAGPSNRVSKAMEATVSFLKSQKLMDQSRPLGSMLTSAPVLTALEL